MFSTHDVPSEMIKGKSVTVKKTVWARGRHKKTSTRGPATGRGRGLGTSEGTGVLSPAQSDDGIVGAVRESGEFKDPLPPAAGSGTSTEGTVSAGGERGENPPISPGSWETVTPRKKKSGAQKRRQQRERRSGGPGGNSRDSSGLGLSSSSGEGLKRYRSAGSTPPELRQTQKRANNRADGSANDAMVVLAIVCRDFPETLLEETQVRALDEAVVLHVMKQNNTYVPQFEARRLVDGALHVTCRSMADNQWLQDNVAHLKPWDGADLVVKTPDQLPKRTRVMMYTKTGGSALEILKVLGTFNQGLRTESWRVLDFKSGDLRKDNTLLVSVTERDLRELRRLDMRPCLGLGRVKCHVLGGGGSGSGSKGVTASQQPEQGSETSNMEVDNPATISENALEGAADNQSLQTPP